MRPAEHLRGRVVLVEVDRGRGWRLDANHVEAHLPDKAWIVVLEGVHIQVMINRTNLLLDRIIGQDIEILDLLLRLGSLGHEVAQLDIVFFKRLAILAQRLRDSLAKLLRQLLRLHNAPKGIDVLIGIAGGDTDGDGAVFQVKGQDRCEQGCRVRKIQGHANFCLSNTFLLNVFVGDAYTLPLKKRRGPCFMLDPLADTAINVCFPDRYLCSGPQSVSRDRAPAAYVQCSSGYPGYAQSRSHRAGSPRR